MTLKEKFKFPIDANNKINDYVAKQCEKIADEFAIGFAEWCDERYSVKIQNFKELLEIYKKEKGYVDKNS